MTFDKFILLSGKCILQQRSTFLGKSNKLAFHWGIPYWPNININDFVGDLENADVWFHIKENIFKPFKMYDFMGKCVAKYLLYAYSIFGPKINMIMNSILQN
jgi:hypothetical protein